MHSYYQNKADAVKGQQRWTDPARLETTLSAINNTPIAAAAWASNDYLKAYSPPIPKPLVLTVLA